ncbi:MAG TPA: hypothetical protein VEM38_13260 [Burkholderiales bacterium]|nr:hypothetical protein [Burkholderiales bacterium]
MSKDDPSFKGIRRVSEGIEAAREALQTPLLHEDIDLSVARSLALGTAKELKIAGNSLYVDQKANTGNARLFFTPRGEVGSTPVTIYPGWIGYKPFVGLYLENDAQAGQTLRLIYGTDVDFRSSAGSGVTVLNSPRANYYDRGATTKQAGTLAANSAPHGQTIRWTYTVPTNRRLALEFIGTWQMRDTVAAPVGTWFTLIDYQPSGAGLAATLMIVQNLGNNINDRDTVYVGASMTLYPGDTLRGSDSDASTGGSTRQLPTFKGTEYDA